MKVAILADSIVNRGGVERMILLCARHWNADVFACEYTSATTFEELCTCKINLIRKPTKSRAKALLNRIAFRKLRLKGYDVFLFFGGASLEASRHHHPNVWYCNSPLRYVHDLY